MPRLSKIGAACLAAFGWTSGEAAVSASYLVVAGGGGGAQSGSGGGGAGGLLTGTTSLNLTLSYTVTVGAGGTAGTTVIGSNGANSVFDVVTATGGGAGGPGGANGAAGGSSGGGGNSGGTSPTPSPAGQGNTGGAGGGASQFGGGGGGGAGGAGVTGASGGAVPNPSGGAGSASSITGSSVTYAGGGGGGHQNQSGVVPSGGAGGGGNGATSALVATAGAANFGGGGGGGGSVGANGGSGVVIISYPSPQKFGGGIVTTSGANTIHTFTTSGTLSPLSSLTASYLIVAGGGSGGRESIRGSGGGGAGGLLSGSGLTLDTNSIYVITVGAGGASQTTDSTAGNNGTNSTFSMVSTAAVGGGGGGIGASGTLPNAKNGGSGGGAGADGAGASTAGTGTSGQGNNGGTGFASASTAAAGGGGGGSSAVGGNASSSTGGTGGAGTSSSITGSAVTYAGGGGGGGSGGGTAGSGGGGTGGTTGGSGTANTGSGGGGIQGSASGAGGSGIVIISYPGSTQQMAGGTVTVAGGNVIHTFTSSGYLTPIVLVTNSLRFRGSASAYLNRTPTVAGNRKTYTFSQWVKRGSLGTQGLYQCGTAGALAVYLFTSGDNFAANLNTGGGDTFSTTQVFRDPSAWYHIVISVDTNQATASDRVKLYVNGVQVTSFTTTNYPTLGADTFANMAVLTTISRTNAVGAHFDGYTTEFNFIDGQALTPNSFGTFNGLGVWQPIRYGGSYGTNGFYLPFNPGTSSFSGLVSSSDYLTAPSNAAFSIGTGDFTMETWFYPTNASQSGQFFFVGSGGIQMGYQNSSTWGLGQANVAWQTTTNTLPTTNAWNHMAITRSGTTVGLFMNGVRLTTGTISTNYSQNTCVIGQGIIGYMSNSRMVKGTAVYNPANPTYTVPTSPLTNVSGTSVLTFQNSTGIDNSSNAFTLTTTGTVTYPVSYPFVILSTIANDQSPQGNNWTINNISLQPGVTYDSMTDVPTLTSATTANYCVMNPLRPSSYGAAILTNGNLNVAQNTTAYVSSTSTFAASSGKWYWEVTCGVAGFVTSIGIATNPTVNGFATGMATYHYDGSKYIGGTNSAYGASYTNGDVLGFALDMDAGTLVCYKNNASQGTLVSGLTGDVYAYATLYGSNNVSYNFGQRPFAYTPPSGFIALNTFNLPTPTIGASAATQAGKYFNAVTYTGTGAGQTISGIGFQPDFVWMKCRDTSVTSNILQNAVTGVTKGLESNSTGAEFTDSSTLTAFTSDGFTAGGNLQTNQSSKSYVAWNWRASNTTAVTNTAGSISAQVSANTTAGFSVVTFTTPASGNFTVGHGLGIAPAMFILKTRSGADSWYVYHKNLSTPASNYLTLNATSASASSTSIWGNTNPTSSVLTLGTNAGIAANATGLLYCFSQIAGYSAFGSYTGNASTDGPFVFTGFRPRFVMLKRTDSTSNWYMFDTSRNTFNVMTNELLANSSNAEANENRWIDCLSNGFKIRNDASSQINASGATMIYMAFAESPFKYANAR